jgi:alcohol dehydrogenase
MEAAGGASGRSVCVFGAGLLGLTACAMARVAGAELVVCVEPDGPRRDRAGAFGADRVGHPRDLGAIAIDTVGEDGFDIVLEISGHPEALEATGRFAAVGGSVVLVGSVFPGPPWVLDPERIIRRHLTIKGVHNYAPSHLSAAVSFLETHHRRFPFAGLVARWYPLDAANQALAHAGRAEAIRVGLAPAR